MPSFKTAEICKHAAFEPISIAAIFNFSLYFSLCKSKRECATIEQPIAQFFEISGIPA